MEAFSSGAPSTYPKGCHFYSPQFFSVIKSKINKPAQNTPSLQVKVNVKPNQTFGQQNYAQIIMEASTRCWSTLFSGPTFLTGRRKTPGNEIDDGTKGGKKSVRANPNFFFIGRQSDTVYLADHNTERYKVQSKKINKNDIIK